MESKTGSTVSSSTMGHRLMITRMILENFKSYAGTQEIGPFHKRFSSIVGPNGSGKSNVIDALLFVFGKRAKQLRLNKVSELIHKSANYPNLDYAKVEVHFQLIVDDEADDDNYDVVPNSCFVVSRTAFQNNQSKYTVDSRSTTYTDVGLLLRKHGIDLDNNRFLILQGEVEQIAMMKPKACTPHEEGLLEYLEDIIGSNRFVERIDEASKSLEVITEQRVEKVHRLKVAEKERDNLSGSKLEAEAFILKERDIRVAKNTLYQLLEHRSSCDVDRMTSGMDKAMEKLSSERNKLKESETQLSAIQLQYDAIKADYDKVSLELQSASTQYDAFERNDVKLQEDMRHARSQIKKQQAAAAKEAKREADCAAEAVDMKVQIGKYEQLISDFQSKKVDEEAQLEAIMAGLQESTQGLRCSLEAVQIQLIDQEKAVSSLQTEKESVETAIKLLQSRAANALKSKSQLEEKLQRLVSDRASMSERAALLEGSERSTLLKKIKATEDLIADCDKEEQALQQLIRDAVTATEIAKASLTSQQSRSGQDQIVQRIMRASKKGGVLSSAGVHGRLGDLGSISAEYDVAVSTSCGMLDYIVVDTADGGQACINFLREMNLGRASFIILDQMGEWADRMDRKLTVPSSAPRLFDLVAPARDAYRPAFYMALRDTLVAQDLDHAVKVAYEGDRAVWRVVTKDGNLIDTSGAMSGGGRETRSGAMKLLQNGSTVMRNVGDLIDEAAVTPAQIQELEVKLSQLQQQLGQCREKKSAAEIALKECVRHLKDLDNEIQKSQIAISRQAEQERDLTTRLGDVSNQCVLTADEQCEVAAQEKKLGEVEMSIGKVSPNLRALQNEVSSLQRQILSVGGPKLAKVQSKIDSLTAQLESFSTSLSTKTVDMNNLLKQVDKAVQLRLKAESEMTKLDSKLRELVAQQKEMESDALEVVNAVEAAKVRMAGLEGQLQSISKDYHDIKGRVAKAKTVELDLTEEMEKLGAELKECKATSKKWRREAEVVRQQHLSEQREFNAVVRSVLPVSSAAASTTDGSPMKIDRPEEAADPDDASLEHLTVFGKDEMLQFDAEELKRDISIMESQKNKMKSSVNMNALLEYMKKDANYKIRLVEVEQITEARNSIRRSYEDLRRQRLEEFMAGFGVISLKLKEMYQMITLGGDAELELLDSLDPFSEGIVFSVRPPKKSWKNICNLSGGEKTLSSLALVFALHHYKPTPLYVMDEIDAALDFKNVSIVANYIKERTRNAQFVIISLRNNMFELADRLVGIYKTNDATKSVTINPKLFENATKGVVVDSPGAVESSKGAAPLSSPLADVTNRMRLL